ncbi:carbohydrate binding family 9 domain-containing protein [candidate division KSB1 bacterium]|nr:carbohydrate binding family 9 domain-containing protein [candidate division KSB1 bacterium]
MNNRRYITLLIALSLLFIIQSTGNALESSNPAPIPFQPNPFLSLTPNPVTSTIKIDGRLERTWQEGVSFGNFTEYEPAESRQSLVDTRGYITYDNENLYISFICFDPNIEQLRANYSDRDQIYEDDWVCVSIDPYHDYQRAYQFYSNARGIQGDELWQSNGTTDQSYDLVFKTDATIAVDHWAMEMQIPFTSLRFPDNDLQNWAIHFTRYYPREQQYRFSWMPITANNSSFMAQAGELKLTIPKMDADTQTFEILPYTIATQNNFRVDDASAANFGKWSWDQPDGRAGVGIKYGFSSNLIADFTYNPDFSQIESDAGTIDVNFPFAVFFEEKRPFFQEGSDIYAVDQFTRGIVLDQFVTLFYSRSINNPLVAGKISGKFGNVQMGYTTAYDQNTPFLIPFEGRTAVIPSDKKSMTNVFRARYDVNQQSSIGVFASNRAVRDGGMNSVTALDAVVRLNEQYKFLALAALTHTEEPNAPEFDPYLGDETLHIFDRERTAKFDGESFYGYILRTKIQRESRHWLYAFAYQDISPGFRADNGFITMGSYRNYEGSVSYAFRWDEHPFLTSIEPRMTLWRKYNYDNIVKDTGIVPSIVFRFRQQTNLSISGWLFNRENLRGKQFDDAREIWGYIQTNKWKTFSPFIYAKIGREINRRGVEGDPNNPFKLLPNLRYNYGFTWKPTARMTWEANYQSYRLWKEFRKDKVAAQRIIRNTFSYQFTRQMSVRLIGEFNNTNYHDSYLSERINQKTFAVDPLVSYKLNAFSVFYLGAHFGAQNNMYLDWNEVRLQDQSVYLKFQYLFETL